MFEGQPKGLWTLALANTGERFGYYTMLAVFTYFLLDNFGLSEDNAGYIYSGFLAFVYLLPFPGGIIADLVGYSKCVTLGIIIMFLGYLVLAIPAGGEMPGLVTMFGALALICIGTGLFKGNLQVMVGNLYDDAKYADKRDSGFSIFYMAINLGAMVAATAAVLSMQWAQENLGWSKADAYHCAFGIACISLVVSVLIYFCTRSTWAHTDYKNKAAQDGGEPVQVLSPAETKERMIALGLVFAVCTFFWMAFHQNGLTLAFFARSYTETVATGWHTLFFNVAGMSNVINLILIIVTVFSLVGVCQSKDVKGRLTSGLILAACIVGGYFSIAGSPESCNIDPALFQQFNACFVVSLTPIVMAVFGWLAAKGKEPKAPLKIGLGMLVAASAYLLMIVFSLGLPTPNVQDAATEAAVRVTPNILISVYFTLTVAELLLSPVGISFVSKVAPPQYKGAMMGCWFVSTFLGNLLTAVGSMLWGSLPITVVWGVLMGICLISAAFIFSIIKKLNKVA